MANQVKPIPQAAQTRASKSPQPVPASRKAQPQQAQRKAQPKKVAPPQKVREEYEEEPKKKGGFGKVLVIVLFTLILLVVVLWGYKTFIEKPAPSQDYVGENSVVSNDSILAAFDYEPVYDPNTYTLKLNLVNYYDAGSGVSIVGQLSDINGNILCTTEQLQPEQMLPNISIAFTNTSFPKQIYLTLTAYDSNGGVLGSQTNQLNINA